MEKAAVIKLKDNTGRRSNDHKLVMKQFSLELRKSFKISKKIILYHVFQRKS